MHHFKLEEVCPVIDEYEQKKGKKTPFFSPLIKPPKTSSKGRCDSR